MSKSWVMFIATIFLLGNLICLFCDGDWIGADDTSIMANVTGAQIQEIGGVWGIVSAPVYFVWGIIRMMFWDYSFFSGDLEIIQWVLAIFTIATIWGLIEVFVPGIPNLITRR